jgi:hypothetical protein
MHTEIFLVWIKKSRKSATVEFFMFHQLYIILLSSETLQQWSEQTSFVVIIEREREREREGERECVQSEPSP